MSSIGQSQQLLNSYMRNYQDVQVAPMWYLGSGETLVWPRDVTVKNVRHDPLPSSVPERPGTFGPKAHIYMRGDVTQMNTNLVGKTDVTVYADNGDPAANFRLYFREAAANAVLQQSVYLPGSTTQTSINACPVAGLTNAQAFAQYGVAFGGTVAPSTVTTRSDIVGLMDMF